MAVAIFILDVMVESWLLTGADPDLDFGGGDILFIVLSFSCKKFSFLMLFFAVGYIALGGHCPRPPLDPPHVIECCVPISNNLQSLTKILRLHFFPPLSPTKRCIWCVVGIFGGEIIIWTQHCFVREGGINVLAYS